jgi:hypothetical protein
MMCILRITCTRKPGRIFVTSRGKRDVAEARPVRNSHIIGPLSARVSTLRLGLGQGKHRLHHSRFSKLGTKLLHVFNTRSHPARGELGSIGRQKACQQTFVQLSYLDMRTMAGYTTLTLIRSASRLTSFAATIVRRTMIRQVVQARRCYVLGNHISGKTSSRD